MNMDKNWIEGDLLERFLHYAKIHTTSQRNAEQIPSTPQQWELLNLLKEELQALGIEDLELDGHGYLIARIAGNGKGKAAPVVGFMAHVDTASDVSGENVKPQIHKNYDGGPIRLRDQVIIDPDDCPELKNRKGDTLITSDGTTLLGADDKAGVAEIMTAVSWLLAHPELPRAPLEIIFTPDEETGRGMDLFPVEKLRAKFCYTMDGDQEGTLEVECFNAYTVNLRFEGVVIHPGRARGIMVNALSMAASFLNMLPQAESPEATDGRYGFYMPTRVSGELAQVDVEVFLRDFELTEIQRRLEALKAMAQAVERIYPGGKVSVSDKKIYLNMAEFIKEDTTGVDLLEEAIRKVGMNPQRKLIRGGTDGAKLAEMGIATPNVFTGGENYHSLKEWASLQVMSKAVMTIVRLVTLWAEQAVQKEQ